MFIFSGHQWSVSPKKPSRYRSTSLSATSWKHWFSPPQNFILFKLNLQKNTLNPCAWKIYRHVILCIQKYTYYQWMFGKRGEGGKKKKGKGADFLILTQRALRHAISPNYEERERRGGEWDNPKNKKLSVENLEHFPKIHKLSRGAHFLGML